jgi:hypothetical protein
MLDKQKSRCYNPSLPHYARENSVKKEKQRGRAAKIEGKASLRKRTYKICLHEKGVSRKPCKLGIIEKK